MAAALDIVINYVVWRKAEGGGRALSIESRASVERAGGLGGHIGAYYVVGNWASPPHVIIERMCRLSAAPAAET